MRDLNFTAHAENVSIEDVRTQPKLLFEMIHVPVHHIVEWFNFT
jgi:hypothetical protein